MSDLQDIIATCTKRAYVSGINAHKQDILKLLTEAKNDTKCTCDNCEQWLNAFEFLIAKIEGRINA